MRQVHVLRTLAEYPPPTPQPTACRLWQGATRAGYGCFMTGPPGARVVRDLHRWVWEQANGPIPPGVMILHRCDQPLCYRLDHLFSGTQRDNMADCSNKGRARGGGSVKRTTCRKAGHPLKTPPNGQQYCPECLRLARLAARQRHPSWPP